MGPTDLGVNGRHLSTTVPTEQECGNHIGSHAMPLRNTKHVPHLWVQQPFGTTPFSPFTQQNRFPPEQGLEPWTVRLKA